MLYAEISGTIIGAAMEVHNLPEAQAKSRGGVGLSAFLPPAGPRFLRTRSVPFLRPSVDGKWHEIRVQVKSHPEAAVRTRKGYYAHSALRSPQ